ncbi:MAG: CoA pyrophosphatase [Xanthobacter sp.]
MSVRRDDMLLPDDEGWLKAPEGSALADFLERARSGLSSTPPPPYSPDAFPRLNGDHAISPLPGQTAPAKMPRKAAVLVPVMARPEPTILLTLRSAHLSHHAGQVAFPGGRMDPEDRDEKDAAFREAWEEVGLQARFIHALGYMEGYLSSTGYWIVPVVGLVNPVCTLTPNPSEVDEVFEVPLKFLMTPANHERHSREWQGTLRHYYAMPYEGRFIWGVTAGMLRNLYERVYA